ncbi:TPA: hypothetical protein PO758_RS23495 [Escherichia coli]|nr:hypothetical protein [Escherichia coli]
MLKEHIPEKSGHNTKAHGENIRLVVKFNSIVRFRLWQSAKWRGGKYGWGLPPLLQKMHRVVRLTMRLSDNTATTTSVITFLVIRRKWISAIFKVYFVMR